MTTLLAGSGLPDAIVALPAVGLIMWVAFVAFVAMGRRGLAEPVDDQWLRTHLDVEAPEVVRARWSGSAMAPSIDQILRRLERHRKVSLRIETTEVPIPPEEREPDEGETMTEYNVHVRLLVPREQLSDYDRAIMNRLMPDRQEISSAEIQKQYEGGDFDATDAADDYLTKAGEKGRKAASPHVLIRAFCFLVFAAGLVVLFRDVQASQVEPVPFFGAIVLGAFLTANWPQGLTRTALNRSNAAVVLLLIPLAILVGAVAVAHFKFDLPISEHAALGLTISFLAVYAAILFGAAIQPFPDLMRARQYFAAQLAENRTIPKQWVPYAAALDLGVTAPEEPEEEWGYELMV